MSTQQRSTKMVDYGPPRLIVELTNLCNLHCSYCLRDEDALYHSPANFFDVDLLRRVMTEAKDVLDITQVMFTGGEPTLHPGFAEVITAVASQGLTASFVTNGWHFERVWPLLLEHRNTITHVAFSIDGSTIETHDRWRGKGSFERVIKAFARCHAAGFPFIAKVGIRRDTITQLEEIALLVARLGGSALSFGHIMPTSNRIADASALSLEERAEAEREIALLARIFKMRIGIDVGYYNTSLTFPCSALAGTSCNLNYRGHLSLCCNLSGFRGGIGEEDRVADLNQESFRNAYARLRLLADKQSAKRISMLTSLTLSGKKADLIQGSPCLFCLHSFGKTPWTSATVLRPADSYAAH
jgi:MoaA/NifB/PqqE/SkfB family radical SAM enzyme